MITDKSYFPLSKTNLSCNAGYYTSDPDATPNDVKLKRKSKYEPKLLAWIVRERSLKTLRRSFLSLISKCLAKLKKFINEVHKNDEIVFWPDLASAHYSNRVQDYLKGENIEYMPRDKNPANVPELRPIEDFWTEVKRLVYADNW